MGHGKTRKHRKLRKKQQNANHGTLDTLSEVRNVHNAPVEDVKVTTRGRTIRKPARYCLNIGSCPKCQLLKRGEIVREITREGQSRVSRTE